MIFRNSLVFWSVVGIFTLSVIGNLACGNRDDGQRIQSQIISSVRNARLIDTLPWVRNVPSQSTPFYQYTDLIGSAPHQSKFDPTYVPKLNQRVTRREFRGEVSTRTYVSRNGAGVMVYTEVDEKGTKEKYVLIALDSSNGHWNVMRGGIDTGDSYVKTAAKELHEETGGAYLVSEEVLLNETYDVFYSLRANNYNCLFFIKLDYLPANVILQSANAQSDPHFKEMIKYAWIKLDDLIKALDQGDPNFSAQIISGRKMGFNFYPYSFNILTQAYQKGILDHLN